jgi:hypothetical protein
MPTITMMMPISVQMPWPVMNEPFNVPMPWKIHTVPKRQSRTPTTVRRFTPGA